MKILWLVNQATPVVSQAMGTQVGYLAGWLNDLSQRLANECDFYMISPIPQLYNKPIVGIVDGINYFGVPVELGKKRVSGSVIAIFTDILKEVNPDIIHIWGTEYLQTYMMIKASEECGMLDKVVISIQGLVSVYSKHYYAHIEFKDMGFIIPSLREIVRKDSIKQGKRKFISNGKYEIESIRLANHVIGRTDWDRACVMQMNPNIEYHFCNETLRPSFYKVKWDVKTCNRHSLFVSQCSYPIKGFHLVLDALLILKNKYPDVHLYTTGSDKAKKDINEFLRKSTYDKYINKKVKKSDLKNNITYLGRLSEEAMCEQYLKAHVFVSASSIENSPNSVGEAMTVGTPVVSSYVGGLCNIVTHGKEGFLYQADAPYMLAYYIDKIFSDDELALELSMFERKKSVELYCPEENYKDMVNIYNKIAIENNEWRGRR